MGGHLLLAMSTLLPGRVFQKYYAKLASAIRDPVWLANELYSKALISQETCEDVLTTQGTSMRQKVTFLLNCVDGKLTAERKPKHLLRFCDVLEKQRTLKIWGRRMRAEYNRMERMEDQQQHVSESETDVLESTTDWSSESAWEVGIDGTEEDLRPIVMGSQLLELCWNVVVKLPLWYITRTCGRYPCLKCLRMVFVLLTLSILVFFALQRLGPELFPVPFYGSKSNTEATQDDMKTGDSDLSKIVPSSLLAKLLNDSSIPTFKKLAKQMQVRIMLPGDGLEHPLPDVSFLKDILSAYFDGWEISVSGECMDPPGFRKPPLDENENDQQKPVVMILVEVKFLPWPPLPEERRRSLDIVKQVVGIHTQYLCENKCHLEVAVREKEDAGFFVLS